MTILLVLAFFIFFLAVDWFKTHPIHLPSGTMYTGTTITSFGFESLGALAQDGGTPVEETQTDYEI